MRHGVLRIAPFRRLATAWTFSNFGDSALYLTLAIWVKDLTGSDASAGLVFLFLGLPAFLAPLAGHLADRFPRRPLVMIANLVAAGGVMLLGVVDGPEDVWIIYAVTFGYGWLTYVTSACGSGLVRDLVPDDDLAGANGLLNTIDQGLRLLSPLAGAALYAAFGGIAIAGLTAACLVVAAAVVATVRLVETEPTPAAERSTFLVEITAGARHIRRTPVLARLTLWVAVATAITGLANTTIFAAIEQGLRRSSEFFAVMVSVQGVGAVLGGITAAAVIRRLTERVTMTIGLGSIGIGMLPAAGTSTSAALVGAVMVGVGIPWTYVSFTTIRQRATPGRLQGRVSAATNLALNAPQTVGTALGAALIVLVDYRLLVVVMTAVLLVSGAFVFRTSIEPSIDVDVDEDVVVDEDVNEVDAIHVDNAG
jgi:MFS family permease